MKSFCLAVLALLVPRAASATPTADPWLPGSGGVGVGLATGIPFLVMGELSIGVTDYAALGVLGGATPIVSGFGFRPRGAVPISDRWRVLVSAATLYYPPTLNAPNAWWLSRPTALFDAEPMNGVHVGMGGGVVGIVTHDSVFARRSEAKISSPYGVPDRGRTSDAWGTVNAAGSLQISEHACAFVDGTLVLSGHGLAGKDWVGGPPFILFLGVSAGL